MSEPKGRISANVLHYMAGQGAMAAFGLVSSVMLARYLPKPVFGEYSFLIALSILFFPFLDLGGHTLYAVLAARDRSRIGELWSRAVALKLYSLPITIALTAVYFLVSGRPIGVTYVLVLLYTVTMSLLLSTDVAFRSGEQGRSWAIRRVVFESALLLLLFVALAVFHARTATTMLLLSTIAAAVAAGWAVETVVRHTSLSGATFLAQCRKPFDRAEIRSLWPFALNTALWVVYYRETNIFLDTYSGRSDLADFRVAFIIMTSALYIPKAVTWASVPRIAYHDEQLNREKFESLVRQTAGVNTYLAVFLTLGGLLYGERLIALVFGPKYAHLGLTWSLFDLVMGLLFIQQFCTDLLNGIRQERYVVYGLLAGITLLTALSFVLVPRYGTLGAAIGQLVACSVMVPMNLFQLARKVGLQNLHGLVVWRLAVAGVLACAPSLALLYLNFYLSLLVFCTIFGVMSYVLGGLPEQFARLATRAIAFASRRLKWQ